MIPFTESIANYIDNKNDYEYFRMYNQTVLNSLPRISSCVLQILDKLGNQSLYIGVKTVDIISLMSQIDTSEKTLILELGTGLSTAAFLEAQLLLKKNYDIITIDADKKYQDIWMDIIKQHYQTGNVLATVQPTKTGMENKVKYIWHDIDIGIKTLIDSYKNIILYVDGPDNLKTHICRDSVILAKNHNISTVIFDIRIPSQLYFKFKMINYISGMGNHHHFYKKIWDVNLKNMLAGEEGIPERN